MHIQTNFTSGALSPQLSGRVDVQKYFNGAEQLDNFIVRPYGGAHRRPGTKYVATVKTSAKLTRLIPFEFSTTQAYIIEVGEGYMRFFKDGGQIVKTSPASWSTGTGYVVGNFVTQASVTYYCIVAHTSGTFATDLADGKWTAQSVYEIPTVYGEDDVFDLQFAQDADTMYITCKNHPVYKLTRTAHDAWTLTAVTFIKGPYRESTAAELAITLDPSDVTGSVTIVASANLFAATDVCNSYWRFKTGTFKITAYTNPTTVTATVIDTLPDHTASADWEAPAFSPTQGYPGSVTFHEQRLYVASTTLEPQGVWGSQIEDYENMEGGTDDSDAVAYIIASGKVNSIEWLASGKVLFVGTAGGIFTLSSGVSTEPISPTNVRVSKETSYGTYPVPPYDIGNYLYYVQKNTRTIREISYNYDVDSYRAADATILAEHITESGIWDMAHQESPNNVLWCVRNDGKMATMTREVDQEVLAWTLQITDGNYMSVACIPNGEEDQVWVIAQRTVNGNTYQYVEHFMPFNNPADQDDLFFVDCGLTYDSTAADNISGLSHLEGEVVAILSNGAAHPNRTVSSAAITLKQDYTTVQIGLPFTSTLVTMNFEGQMAGGSSQGVIKRIVNCIVRLYDSLGCKVGNETTQDVVSFRGASMSMDAPPPLFTGDKEVAFPSGYDKEAKVKIVQDQPLPLNVLAIVSQVNIEE